MKTRHVDHGLLKNTWKSGMYKLHHIPKANKKLFLNRNYFFRLKPSEWIVSCALVFFSGQLDLYHPKPRNLNSSIKIKF